MNSSIYKKILACQEALDAVPKRGHNAFHKYSYATEADILGIKETLNRNGLIILPTTVAQETGFTPSGKGWAKVTILFRVVDVESGNAIESQFVGYAEDSFDKAIYKATTGANKYFYLKFFGVATEDDPENEKAAPDNSSQQNTWPPKRKDAPQAVNPQKAKENRFYSQTQQAFEEGQAADKRRALVAANRVIRLQKRYNLSNDEVLRIGEIASVKGLAEVGDYTALEGAAQRIQQRHQAAG